MTAERTGTIRPAPLLLRLPDGRTLAWYEFGDPLGVPCIYMPGTPESGLAGGCYDVAATNAGVRWISVDKPGYGRSDPEARRALTDWPRDVQALADHLRLDNFVVAGESGGGPHALAVAHALGRRVSMVVLLAAMGPTRGKQAAVGMRPTNVLLAWLARRAPFLLGIPLYVMSAVVRHHDRLAPVLARVEATAPPADRLVAAHPEFAIRHDAEIDAFRRGTRPAKEELLLFARPWGFSLEDIDTDVHLWHGTADVNVPLHIAVEMSRRLPRVTTHFVDGSAHSVGFEERTAVMRTIAAAGSS